METTKLTTFQKLLKFLILPTIVANLIKALTMDETGFSLKKLLAIYATVEAARLSFKFGDEKNVIWLLGFWLIYAGILIGIYSFKDIAGGVAQIKGTEVKETKTNESVVN